MKQGRRNSDYRYNEITIPKDFRMFGLTFHKTGHSLSTHFVADFSKNRRNGASTGTGGKKHAHCIHGDGRPHFEQIYPPDVARHDDPDVAGPSGSSIPDSAARGRRDEDYPEITNFIIRWKTEELISTEILAPGGPNIQRELFTPSEQYSTRMRRRYVRRTQRRQQLQHQQQPDTRTERHQLMISITVSCPEGSYIEDT